MTETANIRKERIERLLHDLRYEIERGILDGDIEERMEFRFIVPTSHKLPDGVVVCVFRTTPVLRRSIYGDGEPRLRVVE